MIGNRASRFNANGAGRVKNMEMRDAGLIRREGEVLAGCGIDGHDSSTINGNGLSVDGDRVPRSQQLQGLACGGGDAESGERAVGLGGGNEKSALRPQVGELGVEIRRPCGQDPEDVADTLQQQFGNGTGDGKLLGVVAKTVESSRCVQTEAAVGFHPGKRGVFQPCHGIRGAEPGPGQGQHHHGVVTVGGDVVEGIGEKRLFRGR